MITSDRWPFVVLNTSSTASTIDPMSPVPDVPLNTPQSTRMCLSPAEVGTMIRKKSPKPTRYILTRRVPVPFDTFVFFVAGLPALVFRVVIFSEPRVQHVEI